MKESIFERIIWVLIRIFAVIALASIGSFIIFFLLNIAIGCDIIGCKVTADIFLASVLMIMLLIIVKLFKTLLR